MLRINLLAAIAIAMISANPASAAPCRNAAGHAVKCPAKSAQQRSIGQNSKLQRGKMRTHVTDTTGRVNYKW
ncbi:hypothetical protein HFO88_10925 [Rhizobium leguminosarum]|jgi:hypothetical protein|uniref:Transmembrane protein n=1 Tax=Rhizobium leguminosarum bv. viciae TaxID=387 RepID=A0A7G6RK20_RHILV|nr:hypothetical protein [Rhizobium leguminosarum]MBY5900840.1 hypothetical protein [Rhizobium leguminosarum]MBY5907042.1 hypothetical protein [Rhizobium leguminosarum]NKJ96838.1 hypothetical protein [Rhizobium leguminosarum bv. viciae]QND42602.1 hypothetical protein HB770_15125 [Rhizobium leguminosarum bv. viciae]